MVFPFGKVDCSYHRSNIGLNLYLLLIAGSKTKFSSRGLLEY